MLLVTYRGGRIEQNRGPVRKEKDDAVSKLSTDQKIVYDRLRDWRKLRAAAEGINVYVIGVNQLLARIVMANPQSATELSRIHGMGPRRMERFAEDILRILHPERAVEAEPAQDNGAAEQPEAPIQSDESKSETDEGVKGGG